ncbi:glycosyltransferase family 87 protein [soil metagenome]
MTDAQPPLDGMRPSLRRAAAHPIALWAGFVVVHFVLGMLALYGPGYPLGDVTSVYQYWVEYGFSTGTWVGIDTVWVYPIVALIPMLIAHLFGPDFYASTWLSLVMIVDAAAFAVILGLSRDSARVRVAWWWLAFLLLLGPIAVTRIDSITVPFAIMGMLLLVTRPRLAAVLLTVATWIKVWPAALIAAAIVTLRSRVTIVIAAAVGSVVIAAVALVLGGGANLLSFVSQQTGRGLQVEAPIATFWMWDVVRGGSTIYFDTAILTYQLHGPGVEIAASVMTPLLALVTAALLVMGILAIRRGISAIEVLAPLSLAITIGLITFNKVGSPQFVTWLAVPMIFGLAAAAAGRAASFRVPAILTLVIAFITQNIYPYLYDFLIRGNFVLILMLSARNILYLVLLGWAVASLVALIRTHAPHPLTRQVSR